MSQRLHQALSANRTAGRKFQSLLEDFVEYNIMLQRPNKSHAERRAEAKRLIALHYHQLIPKFRTQINKELSLRAAEAAAVKSINL